jgi:hypothetical protein
MIYLAEGQKLIFDTLSGNISASVFDDVPQQPPGMPADSFPYVVIGFDDAESFDTDSWTGAQLQAELHVWSTYKGKLEVKQIIAEIYALLHRQALSIEGAAVVDCLHTFSTIPDVGADKYVHGISRYRLTITEAL